MNNDTKIKVRRIHKKYQGGGQMYCWEGLENSISNTTAYCVRKK